MLSRPISASASELVGRYLAAVGQTVRAPLEIYEQVADRLREHWEASAERHV
jgi:hypothetical protein